MSILYTYKIRSKTILLVFLITSGFCFSQDRQFKSVKSLIEKGENFEAISILEKIDTLRIKPNIKAKLYYYLGKAYGNVNINDRSYYYLRKSEKNYLDMDSIPSAMEVKLEIAIALTSQNMSYKDTKKDIDEYIAYAKEYKNPKLIAKGYFRMASFLSYDEPEKSKIVFFRALEENKIAKDETINGDIFLNLGCLYNERLSQPDSAIYYFKKSLQIARKHNNIDDICRNLINEANAYYYKNNIPESLKLLREADKLPITIYTQNIKSHIHYLLSLNYSETENYKKAFEELLQSRELSNQENFKKQVETISELETRYKTKEKELKILNLNIKNRNNLLLLYLFLGLLIIGSLFGYFRIKFLSKKKMIAEQEKLIESQKLENVLKEQELKEIDKLLEGQEKERIKIANDLHDNLGSLMATLKLNFQNLKLKSSSKPEEHEQLFDKTDELLEEAYQKVRGIAHTKNAGVIANEGLLPAIMNIAKKVTIVGKLNVQVIPFGLEEKLENALEVTIFRMVQELLTNTIKHADASEITIHLTQHHDSLNIIIEDNGKGFNPKNIDKKEGMGLPNIEKKVEQMGGTFTIDSIIGNGTSIIIDLPL